MLLYRLNELLSYDPDTGHFTWKVGRRGHVKTGDRAGKTNSYGYISIKIDGRGYMAHRLAWMVMTGKMPDEEIDHINRDRSDNRFANLREATRQQNCFNTAGWSEKASGLPKGVTFDKMRGKFMARVRVNGKSKNLGRFDTPDAASAAYLVAADKEYGIYAP